MLYYLGLCINYRSIHVLSLYSQQCAILCTVFCPLVAMCYPVHSFLSPFSNVLSCACIVLILYSNMLFLAHKVLSVAQSAQSLHVHNMLLSCTLLKFILANCVLLSALSVLAVIFIIPAHNVLPFYTMCHLLQTLYGHLHIMIFCMYTQSKAQ